MFNLQQDMDSAIQHYPKLNKIYENEQWKLIGEIDVKNEQTDKIIDTYELEIFYPKGYPIYQLPKVRELGKKIPKNSDRHINKDGTMCIIVSPEEAFYCFRNKTKISTSFFIYKKLIPYLANQTLINRGKIKEFVIGEYSHGELGIIEFWKKHFDTQNISIILKCLQILLKRQKLERNDKCFCGKDTKYKNCHLRSISSLKSFPRDYIEFEYKQLIQIIKDAANSPN